MYQGRTPRSYLGREVFQPKTQMEPDYPGQAQNNEGAYTETISCWDRFKRFLCLGSEGGTYYANQRELTLENVECIKECFAEDPTAFVRELVEMRFRVKRRDPLMYALAYASSQPTMKRRDAHSTQTSYISSRPARICLCSCRMLNRCGDGDRLCESWSTDGMNIISKETPLSTKC